MKNIILLLTLFIPFTLLAQDKVEIKSVKSNDQTMQCMTKISTDSVMRITMMEMMIDKTKGNEVEMIKLMNTMMANPEMHKIMMAAHPDKSEMQINSVEPHGMKSSDIRADEMNKTETVIKK